MKTKISAEIVAHSVNSKGVEIVSMLLTYPRIIHSELMTHRVFSRNSASSRAIPFKKMVDSVKKDPFIPIAFQKDHKGMQGTEYFTGIKAKILTILWVFSSKIVCLLATMLHKFNLTKQLCNRLLEPFMWHKVLVTSTEWDNFFELRCPEYEVAGKIFRSKQECFEVQFHVKHNLKVGDAQRFWFLSVNKSQAEIHIQELAECIYDKINSSIPTKLDDGQWHIPFLDKISINAESIVNVSEKQTQFLIKVSTGMCARTSYTVVNNEKNINYDNLVAIHDKMILSRPFHASPFEHCAISMGDNKWYKNFKGFKQYRQIIELSK